VADGAARWLDRGRAAPVGWGGFAGWVALVVVLAAAGAALLPGLLPPGARAQTTARVVVPLGAGDGQNGASRTGAVARVVALPADDAIRAAIAARAGTTPAAVAAGLRVTPADDADAAAAGQVDVVVDAPSADAAGRIAAAAVDVLGAELRQADTDTLRVALGPASLRMQDLANQLRALAPDDPRRAELRARYGAIADEIAERTATPAPRLVPGAAPALAPDRRPTAAAAAAVAALAALVLAVPAALVVVRLRRPAATDPAHDLTALVPGMRAFLVWTDDAPAVLTRFWVGAVRGQGPVLVLQLGDRDRLDLAGELVAAGRLIGDAVVLRDLTPGAPAPAPISGRALVVSALRTPTVDGAALAVAQFAAPAVVLAVDTVRTDRAAVEKALAALRALGREVRGIVVWRGRLPRDPVRDAAGAPG
jgi:hypothetical protein